MPKIARYGSKVMKNNNINQQKQTIKESQATRKYKPSALPLADLIRSINEANKSKPKAKVEGSWQSEPEPPLAA